MKLRHRHHYTPAEATALIPRLERWVARVRRATVLCEAHGQALQGKWARGEDAGGPDANAWTRYQAELAALHNAWARRDIRLLDWRRGAVGLPGFIAGEEVLLWWEEGQTEVRHWQPLTLASGG